MTRTSTRGALVLGLVTALLCWGVAPASAHVILDQAVPQGDGSVEVTFTFDHSCDASPTVELAVAVPEGAEILGGTGPTGWTATTEESRVVFAGPGIGDGAAPRFAVIARLTGSVGQALLFPTRQSCANGDGYDWVDTSESAERPAPRLVATTAVLAEVVASTAPVSSGRGPALPDDGASARQLADAIGVLALVVYVAARGALRRARPGSR